MKTPIAIGIKLINLNAFEATGETITELIVVNLTQEQKEFILHKCKGGLNPINSILIYPDSINTTTL